MREGSPAILNCQTKQSNNVVITWKKGAKWIIDYTNKSYTLLRNHSLYFPSVGKDDEDTYICGATVTGTSQIIYSKFPAYITLACEFSVIYVMIVL